MAEPVHPTPESTVEIFEKRLLMTLIGSLFLIFLPKLGIVLDTATIQALTGLLASFIISSAARSAWLRGKVIENPTMTAVSTASEMAHGVLSTQQSIMTANAPTTEADAAKIISEVE